MPRRWLIHCILIGAAVVLSLPALAFQAGLRQITIPGASANDPATQVALYYPTQAPEREVPMGPFTLQVAIGAVPEPTVKGLIMLSHGTGGSELGHSSLAQALARHGYLVAALRHPRDNWQDHSLLEISPERYFIERPQQVSHVIDALLRDPDWKDRIATDARGPRIGAVGHSAGGYTVLALAGGQPDVSLILRHCATERAADPIFCSMGRALPQASAAALPPAATPAASVLDARVRAVVALAPVGAVLSASSLGAIHVPTAIYEAEQDHFLVPRFHAEWIHASMPAAQMHRVPNAWHFAFMDTPSMPLQSPDGDIGADPPGFDRQAFLQQLGRDLPAFFDQAWR